MTDLPLRLIRLTPPGRGAVATLRVEGPGAVEAVARHFTARGNHAPADVQDNRLLVGRFGRPQGEEIVLRIFGKTRTGTSQQAALALAESPGSEPVPVFSDEAVELHCHGGLAAVERLQEILVTEGCKVVSWQEWAAASEQDPIVAEARVALAEARTQPAAAILLDQYRGALSRAMADLRTAAKRRQADDVRRMADELLARAPLGLHLVRPWQIVVAGPTNAGKSSLINALAGYQRAIVHPKPGTTRDVVRVPLVLGGWAMEFSDTAGLRSGGEAIEQAGRELARARLAEADLALLVFDGSQPWGAAEQALCDAYKSAMLVHNKADLPSGGPRPAGHAISALAAEGIEELCQAIVARLVSQPPPPGAAVPFTLRQVEEIRGY